MKALLLISKILLHLVGIAFLLLYLNVVIYEWPESSPFNGSVWYNPYENVLRNDPLRANFHAHTRSWAGVTFGENSEKEMADAYSERRYDIIGISNYHSISTYLDSSQLYIPVYEHGLNALKVHNLPLGATEVLLPLYPVHFTIHQTQQMLLRTAGISRLNALCHPTMSRIAPRKMSRLTGYSLLEVGNTLGMSVEHWDMALSSGRLVWILSNDDTHDLVNEPTFIKWNMIYAGQKNSTAALYAMQAGAHYGVESYMGQCENTRVSTYRISGDTLVIGLDQPVNRIDLYGQDGALLASAGNTAHISYKLKQGDTYVRSEAHMDECVYYFNPVVRTIDGVPVLASSVIPAKNTLASWLIRIALSIVIILLSARIYRFATRSVRT